MQYLKKFSQASDNTVLTAWVSATDYRAAVYTLRLVEYDATEPKVRRRIKRILAGRGLLPTNRAATSRDYARIKAELWEQQKHEEMI